VKFSKCPAELLAFLLLLFAHKLLDERNFRLLLAYVPIGVLINPASH
jgi:hypothetical protein